MAHRSISRVFPVSKLYQAHIPTYPSGHWLFGFASKGPDPLQGQQAERWNELGIRTRYYNTDLHRGGPFICQLCTGNAQPWLETFRLFFGLQC